MTRLVRRLWPVLLILSLLLSGCAPTPAAEDLSFMSMDTYIHFTAYGSEAQAALIRAQEEVLHLESLLDVNRQTSQVYAINHRQENTLTLSQDTGSLLSLALELAHETGGTFDPTIYPIVRSWGFTTGTYSVPDADELAALLPLVGYDQLRLDGLALTLQPGMMLDFGGIAKGFAGDRAAQLLKADGISCAILRLGGNIQTLGTKPDGSLWTVGIQDPDSGGTLATVSVADRAVVTSGSYQRYFTVDGQVYHHIIDPATASPADSGLACVTVVGPSGARCDALSTALFVMGIEKGAQFWRDRRDFEAVFVSTDGSIAITAGLEGNFTLSASQTRAVEVLK